jgi:ubiquitin-conjugating enzyme E2 J2
VFPSQYPMKPPGIEMITPNGRFEPNKRICMSMSDYHPESWNPAWHTQTILLGLISFMNTDELTTGCIMTSDIQKRKLAKTSVAYNFDKQPLFPTLFAEHLEAIGLDPKIKDRI